MATAKEAAVLAEVQARQEAQDAVLATLVAQNTALMAELVAVKSAAGQPVRTEAEVTFSLNKGDDLKYGKYAIAKLLPNGERKRVIHLTVNQLRVLVEGIKSVVLPEDYA